MFDPIATRGFFVNSWGTPPVSSVGSGGHCPRGYTEAGPLSYQTLEVVWGLGEIVHVFCWVSATVICAVDVGVGRIFLVRKVDPDLWR